MQLLTPPQTSSPRQAPAKAFEPTIVYGSFTSPVTIGRGTDCTYRIRRSQKQISRKHATIEYDPDKRVFCLRVGGQNGLKVDGEGYKIGSEITLTRNDTSLDIVGELFRFRIPSASSADSKQPAKRQPLGEIVNGNALPPDMSEPSHADQSSSLSSIPTSDLSDDLIHVLPDEPRSIKRIPEATSDAALPEAESSSPAIDISFSDLSSLPSDDIEDAEDGIEVAEVAEPCKLPSGFDLASLICDAIVFSRLSSIPASDIYGAIMASQPTLKDVNPGPVTRSASQDDLDEYESDDIKKSWLRHIVQECKTRTWFGEIIRTGKDAAGRKLENEYFYKVDDDEDEMRREFYGPIIKPTRACRTTHKQVGNSTWTIFSANR